MKKAVLIAILAIATVAVAMAQVGTEFNDNNSGLYFRVTSLKPNEVKVIKKPNYYYTGNINIPSSVSYDGANYSVTAIGNSAFADCSRLTTVNIGNSVKTIGNSAFADCSSLTTVNIGNSVTTIGEWAFYRSGITDINVGSSNPRFASDNGILFSKNMDTLICYPRGKTNSTYTIPGSVTVIGESAFEECGSLTSVNIPNSVTEIGYWAFYSCSSLTTINIPNSVTAIGNSAFFGCSSLESVNIGNSVTAIGSYAFWDCTKLTSIDIPNSVTSIGNEAFSECSSLTTVNIGNSVTEIGDYAFWDCTKLTSVNIGNSVETIGNYAFSRCSSLKKIKIDVINPASITLGQGAFDGIRKGNYADACILLVPPGSVPDYSNAPQWKKFMPNIIEQ